MAKGHGGDRAGSGRKALLTRQQMSAVGSEYARLWRNAERGESIKAADVARWRLRSMPIPMRSLARGTVARDTVEDVSSDVDAAFGTVKSLLRAGTARKVRPYGLDATITAIVRIWCWEQFRVRIKARHVMECRKVHDAEMRRVPRSKCWLRLLISSRS